MHSDIMTTLDMKRFLRQKPGSSHTTAHIAQLGQQQAPKPRTLIPLRCCKTSQTWRVPGGERSGVCPLVQSRK